jgi:hypothetical protein
MGNIRFLDNLLTTTRIIIGCVGIVGVFIAIVLLLK